MESGRGTATLKVKDEDIPIVELADGQSVLIYAHAVMGTAKKHVKWQVASGVGYKYMPVIDIDGSKIDAETVKEVADKCPKKVFEIVKDKLEVKRLLDCSLCSTCSEIAGEDAIKVKGDDTNFVFKFETDGSLTAQQVLDKAAEILSEEAKAFADSIGGLRGRESSADKSG